MFVQQYESAAQTFVTQPAVSQPFLSGLMVVPSQSEWAHVPCGGEAQHFEALHVSPVLHAVPHAPQFFVSVAVLVHALVQYVRPVVQQWLFVHVCALVHAFPHVPQLALSVVVSVQFDAQHASCAQSVLHVPQCVLSLVVL
jgi:hypothetical protein